MQEPPVPALADRVKKATTRIQPKGMFQLFTEQARRVVHLAQEEALLFRHDSVGPEHLLLGLLYEGEGFAAQALESLDISRERVLAQVKEIVGQGHSVRPESIPFTLQAKQAMERSLREALSLGHHYIGTEHLLLGLLREVDSVTEQVLTRLGVDHVQVWDRIMHVLNQREQADQETSLAIPAELADTAENLARVERQKQAAFGAGDLDRAATLRDEERRLLASKLRLEQQWIVGTDVRAVIAENRQLRDELNRLRGLLRQP